jgi:hypothetical protein
MPPRPGAGVACLAASRLPTLAPAALQAGLLCRHTSRHPGTSPCPASVAARHPPNKPLAWCRVHVRAKRPYLAVRMVAPSCTTRRTSAATSRGAQHRYEPVSAAMAATGPVQASAATTGPIGSRATMFLRYAPSSCPLRRDDF